ncbi:MAG: hypothetical protein P4M11_08230 [Candidatus Pacebacteria bacterium]|nr:hypothetical protein [Candidatus Paceibacterota bacterium]
MSFYIPVQNARAFRREKAYDQIHWNNFREVVDEFHGRIDDWYILPTKVLINHKDGGHFVFPIMAINCLLIDTLSQYYYGADRSPHEGKSSFPKGSSWKFKDFLIERMKHRTGPLPTKIASPQHDLINFEDVLYSGFRCGILHQAHIPLYGAVYGVKNVVDFQLNGATKYADGTDCPTVICFPQKLFDELETVFIKYLNDLVDPNSSFDNLRRHFKEKFEDSFGVTINTKL